MENKCALPVEMVRYSRQIRFPALGESGQRRLARGRALLCGCGALGSAVANLIVRAGIGTLRIIDRDFVEIHNLQRQTLFDEADARNGIPKAIAAAEKLRSINSTVVVEAIVADLTSENIEQAFNDVDVVLDGTDNFETRFLMNDAAVKLAKPWIYGGCVGAEGQTMTIVPGETPCLRCLMPECPAPGSTATCETAGILGPIVGIIASWEAVEAIKLLSGNGTAISRHLVAVDLWTNRIRQMEVRSLRDLTDCPTCKHNEYVWLSGRHASQTAVLCGRNAVQISRPEVRVSLEELAQRWQGMGRIVQNSFLVRLNVEGCELTVFRDGRAIISGTNDTAAARAIYAKYIGV